MALHPLKITVKIVSRSKKMFPQFIISLIKTDMNLHFVIECVTRLDDIVRWGCSGWWIGRQQKYQ